jgi:hypothetical protein
MIARKIEFGNQNDFLEEKSKKNKKDKDESKPSDKKDMKSSILKLKIDKKNTT